MNPKEVEILLKTVYKGEGITKAIQDLDKISASGSKLSGVMGKVNKALGGDVFGGASEAFKKRNPQLFNATQRTIGALMPNNAYLSQGAKQLMEMGPLFPPYKGPPPPFINPASAPGAGGKGGGGLIQQFGNRLLSRALGVTAGLLVYKAINLPLQALTKTIKGLNDAIEHARKLYASALTSGLGLQFTAKRNLLAETIGVSEKDVFQFGSAIAFLNGRLDYAANIMAKTTPQLTAVSYQFKILEANLAALFATLANDVSSSLIRFADSLARVLNVVNNFLQNPIVATALDSFVQALLGAAVVAQGKDSGPAPDPTAYMKQIHASALEHMGLIVGGIGGATDFAAQTAQNTKKTAAAVENLAKKLSGGRYTSFFDPLMSVP